MEILGTDYIVALDRSVAKTKSTSVDPKQHKQNELVLFVDCKAKEIFGGEHCSLDEDPSKGSKRLRQQLL